MIGRLCGILAEKQPPSLLLDVNGVGYEVEAPMSTFYQLPAVGERATLYTHLAIRDDAHLLFGFASESERRLFRVLIKVNGVGAKMALTILSGITGSELARCIQDDDTATLVRLPGIGKKTAERLIVEMRDRLDDWQGEAVSPGTEAAAAQAPQAGAGDELKDAISALVSLGYKPQEASRLLSRIDTEGMNSEAMIRAALQQSVNQ